MNVTVIIGGTDYSNRVLKCSIHKNDTWFGKLAPNEATVVLSNHDDNWTAATLPSEDTTITIDINGTRHFTGYVRSASIAKKTVRIQAVDKWKKWEKLKCTDTVYMNISFLSVLNDLASQAGETSTSFEDPGITITFWHVEEGTKLRDAMEELVKSVGGSLWYDENGVLTFTAGFASSYPKTPVDNLYVQDMSKIEITQRSNEVYDQVRVKFKERTLDSQQRAIYVGAIPDQPFIVPADGYPDSPDEEFWVEFDKPIHYLAPYSSVTFVADSGVTLNQTVYENNFADPVNGIPKNPWKIRLQIDNANTEDKQVHRFVVFGKFVEETDSEAVHGSGSTVFEYENDVIDNADWAGKLAQWLYEEFSYNRVLNVTVANFTKAISYKIGDRLNVYDDTGIMTTYRIADMNIDAGKAKITLKLIKDRAEDFVYSGATKKLIGDARRPWIDGRDLGDSIDLSDGAGGSGTTIKGGPNSKDMVSPSGIRQIYCISMVDQIDSTHSLDIPIYIPENAGGGSASGTARIKVKTVPFRAYATSAAVGGGTKTSTEVWSVAGDTVNSNLGVSSSPGSYITSENAGSHTHPASDATYALSADSVGHAHDLVDVSAGGNASVLIGSNTHSHLSTDFTTNGGHSHGRYTGYYDVATGSTDHAHSISSDGAHTHSISASGSHDHDATISGSTESDAHGHSISGYTGVAGGHTHDILTDDIAGCHTHPIDRYWFRHTHDVDISHSHSLVYGIYEYAGTPTTNVYHVVGATETLLSGTGIPINSEWDYVSLNVSDGDIISVRADDLVRIYVYIFVEYTLT